MGRGTWLGLNHFPGNELTGLQTKLFPLSVSKVIFSVCFASSNQPEDRTSFGYPFFTLSYPPPSFFTPFLPLFYYFVYPLFTLFYPVLPSLFTISYPLCYPFLPFLTIFNPFLPFLPVVALVFPFLSFFPLVYPCLPFFLSLFTLFYSAFLCLFRLLQLTLRLETDEAWTLALLLQVELKTLKFSDDEGTYFAKLCLGNFLFVMPGCT